MEFYTAERKKELIPFATEWMELESIMLCEISQVVRDKYHMISPLTRPFPSFFPYPPPPSPLVSVSLFLVSMFLVLFCLFVCLFV